jgi:hypothetical protein
MCVILSRLRYCVLDRPDFASIAVCDSYFPTVTSRLLLQSSTYERFSQGYAFF